VLRRGELQLTQEQRKKLLDEKRKSIVTMIAEDLRRPQDSLPHPPIRVEQAMQEARISIDPFQEASEQTKMGRREDSEHHPPEVGEGQAPREGLPAVLGADDWSVENFGEIVKEDWGADGTLSAIVEIPAGSSLAC